MILVISRKNNETKSELGRVAQLSSRDALGTKVKTHWGIFDERIALNLQNSCSLSYAGQPRFTSAIPHRPWRLTKKNIKISTAQANCEIQPQKSIRQPRSQHIPQCVSDQNRSRIGESPTIRRTR